MNDDLDNDDQLSDEDNLSNEDFSDNIAVVGKTHNSETRRRIEELQEQKRLKALLDDVDDWDF